MTTNLKPLIAASTISAFGSAVVSLAYTYISYKISGSLVVAVAVMALQALPSAVLIRVAARVAQRFDVRTVSAAGQAAKIALNATIAVIILVGDVSLFLLFGAAFVSGIISALIGPSWHEFLQNVSSADWIAKVEGQLSSWGAVAGIVGVITGGGLLTLTGAAALFGLNAISYLFPLVAILALPKSPPKQAAPPKIRKAVSIIRDTVALRHVVIIAVALELLAWPILKLLPKIADDVDPRPITFSLLLAAFYLGNAGVSVVLNRGMKRYSYFAILVLGIVILSAAFVLVAVTTAFPASDFHLFILMVVLVPIGLSLSLASTVTSASVQLGAPKDEEADTLALYAAIVTIMAPVGGLVVAGVVSLTSPSVVIVAETLGLIALVFAVRWPSVRKHFDLASARDVEQEVLRHHAIHPYASHAVSGEHQQPSPALVGSTQ
jgi:MFS family permease